MGRGVQAENGDLNAVLDRAPPQRTSAVVGQGAATDGFTRPQVQLKQLDVQTENS